MSTTPLFSVIIPTYNRCEKLMRALHSLNDQTYLNFEVLVCDDGSMDNTSVQVENFSKNIRFNSLQYFFQPNWGGPARPRNIGIGHAKGEWICFLDSDDSWHSTKLEKVLEFINIADLIYHDFEISDAKGRKKNQTARTLKAPVFEDLMINGHNGCIINSGVCVRTRLVQGVGNCSEDRKLIGVEDADLWLRIAMITDRFIHIRKALGTYYMEGGNLTVYNENMIKQLLFLFHQHAPLLKHRYQQNLAQCSLNYHLARIKRMMKQYSEAMKLYRSSSGSPNPALVWKSVVWLLVLQLKLWGKSLSAMISVGR